MERRVMNEKILKDFTNLVEDRYSNKDSISILGRRVFHYLFEGVPFDEATTLTICPSGYLNHLPFGALVTEENRYLVEEFPLNFVPNSSYYTLKNNPQYNSMSILPYTKPLENTKSKEFPPLTFAERESQQILNSNGKIKSKILSKNNLTKAEILKGLNSDIFHLCTHAVSNEHQKFGSFIVYYTQKDEKIYGYDLLSQPIKTKLVVLNGCRTDKGLSLPGEGVFSLTNSFLMGGVRHIVTTTQSVNDQSSTYLMEYFYKKLFNKTTVVIALQKAQLFLLKSKQYSHPYYWCGYRIYGS
jgi:CHAT domain-containing protein